MKHEEFGAESIKGRLPSQKLNITLNPPSDLKKEVAELVRAHHHQRPGHPKYTGNNRDLLDILVMADHHSAMHDRDRAEDSEEKTSITPLLSVYSYVDIGFKKGTHVYYPISLLSTKKGAEPLSYENAKNNRERYEKVFKEFKKEIENMTFADKGDINTLLYILQKYTKYIPSAVYLSVPDIPLYDHLKTTAAIALSVYRSKKKEKYALLIMGDLSGIQNYIFSNFKLSQEEIVNHGGTKRLRGRSLLINLIIDSAVRYIVEKFDLYEFNILWQSGGNFLVMIPNTDENRRILPDIKREINKFLIDKFGDLYLSMAWIDWDANMELPDALSELHRMINDDKSHRYIEFFDDKFFVSNIPSGKYLCPVCGRNIVNKDDEKCADCVNIESIGGKIVKARYIVRYLGEHGDFTFRYGNTKISYLILNEVKDPEKIGNAEIFSIDNFEIPNFGKTRGFKLLKTYAPSKSGMVMSISQLVSMEDNLEDRNENGKKGKVGVLKADVDCLGEIFARGLKKQDDEHRITITTISELSFLMDAFFTVEIMRIAKENNIYVVFSGGDDLTVVGRYDEILKFSKELKNSFSRWVGHNDNIHFSAAIVFFGEKFPLRRGVEIAEEGLEQAKNVRNAKKCVERGNNVFIFGRVLSWDKFLEQVDLSEKLLKLQGDGKIPASFSHYLLKIHSLMHFSGMPKRGQVLVPSHVPYLKYYFGRRNGRGSEVLEDLESDEIFENIPVAVSLWVMERKYKGV